LGALEGSLFNRFNGKKSTAYIRAPKIQKIYPLLS